MAELLRAFVVLAVLASQDALLRGGLRHRRLVGVELDAGSGYDIKSGGNGVHTITFEVAGKPMSFETGKIGRQASGSVMARTMDTMVYSTVCCEREAQPVDFTPLRVDFFARYSAVGQTIGAFHRRDSRGDDNEILVARLIDRPIRPMIAEGWQHETQILAWVMSYDKQHSPDALAINAASAAMCLSEVPMSKPVAGVEVALVQDEFIVNPTKAQSANATLQLTVAGTKEGILMIEGAADFLSEELMMSAIKKGHEAIGVICDALAAFQQVAGKAKKIDTLRKLPEGLVDSIDAQFGAEMRQSLSIGDKHERGRSVSKVEAKIVKRFCTDAAPASASSSPSSSSSTTKGGDEDPDSPLVVGLEEEEAPVVAEPTPENMAEEDEASELGSLVRPSSSSSSSSAAGSGYGFNPVDVKISTKKLLVRNLRSVILKTGRRSDGRGVEDVRPISIETNLLPGAHGSSLFKRGETQSVSTATLGSKAMEMRVETLDSMGSKRFYLQYRFPPSSVGEVGRVGGVNRREAGHGNLAERALVACLPAASDFPYSIRAESLITESCGSSSMATVCGCCLAMLDSGVPLKTHVAGVAMGLILGETSDEEPVILTDILGLEDALGTMDFKIAGNETGITTFQLDIKSEGLTPLTLQRALAQAKRGRLHILKHMRDALSGPRPLKDSIPKILSFMIPTEALGKVIGPKGATVTKLIETHKLVNINLDDSGLVQVRAPLPSLSQSLSLFLSLSSLSPPSLLSLPRSSSLTPFTPLPTSRSSPSRKKPTSSSKA